MFLFEIESTLQTNLFCSTCSKCSLVIRFLHLTASKLGRHERYVWLQSKKKKKKKKKRHAPAIFNDALLHTNFLNIWNFLSE